MKNEINAAARAVSAAELRLHVDKAELAFGSLFYYMGVKWPDLISDEDLQTVGWILDQWMASVRSMEAEAIRR